MKKLLMSAMLLGASTTAMAVSPGGPNCGWGNLIFEGQSGLPAHFLASIVDGTSGNATFGMTSGTNGCSTDGSLTYGGDSLLSFGNVLDEFSEDVARGDGEALAAVAVSMGISETDRDQFKTVMHQNFDRLFPSADVNAEQVFTSMVSVMRADNVLGKYVS
jgi:hypothetical protein